MDHQTEARDVSEKASGKAAAQVACGAGDERNNHA
jgi:hypothetical protein